MTAHKHRVKSTRTTPFFHPVAVRQNQAAHGGVTKIATCACGAERHTNVNGSHVERGAWS